MVLSNEILVVTVKVQKFVGMCVVINCTASAESMASAGVMKLTENGNNVVVASECQVLGRSLSFTVSIECECEFGEFLIKCICKVICENTKENKKIITALENKKVIYHNLEPINAQNITLNVGTTADGNNREPVLSLQLRDF